MLSRFRAGGASAQLVNRWDKTMLHLMLWSKITPEIR